MEDDSEVRITLITPPAPYMFPPTVFYARQVDPETVEMIGVDFQWDYWNQVGDDPTD